MRKTPTHNPRGFDKNTWNYRSLQLRHALGWTQRTLARVAGIPKSIIEDLERGKLLRPGIPTIRRIKAVEATYADILKAYKRSPVRMSRLRRQEKGRVRLLPVEIRRPQDIETMGEVGSDSKAYFFGRKTRRDFANIGRSESFKARERRRGEAISRGWRKKIAAGWRPGDPHKKVQLRQPPDDSDGQGRLDK